MNIFRCLELAIAMFIIIQLGSCQNIPDRLDDPEVTEILIDNTNLDVVDISDRIDDITIIPLKESPEHYLGGISKVFALNSMYIVFDYSVTKQILLFDKEGEFIKVIMKTGAGPDETLQINDCWINYKGELEVYDYALKKLYQFDSSFTLRKTIKSTDFYLLDNIMRIPNTEGYVGYAGFKNNPPFKGKRYRVAFIDKNLNIDRTDMHFEEKFKGVVCYSIVNAFFAYKDSLRMFQPYDNNVYEIAKSGTKKKFKLAYKKNGIPDNVFEKLSDNDLAILRNIEAPFTEKQKIFAKISNYAYFSGVWLENDRYIYVTSMYEDSYFFSFIDKRNMKEELSAKWLLETERFKTSIPMLSYYDSGNDRFIGVVQGTDLKGLLLDGNKFKEENLIDDESFYIYSIKFK